MTDVAPTTQSGQPAGWYDDPNGSGQQRWWDGENWTDKFAGERSVASGLGAKVGGLLKDRVKSVTSGISASASSVTAEVKQNLASASEALKGAGSNTEASATDVEKPVYEVVSHIDGKNAKVSLWPDRLEWERARGVSGAKVAAGIVSWGTSLLVTGVKGGKDAYEMIPLNQIASVGNRKDGMLYHLVEVTSAGGTVGFRVSRDEAVRFRQAILDQMQKRANTPAVVQVVAPAPAASAPSAADELAKLGQLFEQGILSADEFAAAKAKALGL